MTDRGDDPVGRGRRPGAESGRWLLSELFPAARFYACNDIGFGRFTDRPDACGPGDLFVARCGDDDDGHEQIAAAIARGAAGIVAERMVPTAGVPLCVVKQRESP